VAQPILGIPSERRLLASVHHEGLRERVLVRSSYLAAWISLDHRLGPPSRALVDHCA